MSSPRRQSELDSNTNHKEETFVVIFDANVLYPPSLRDCLMRLAWAQLFQAKWTDAILDEMVNAIAKNHPMLVDRLARTRDLMNAAIPSACVRGYENLIPALQLPDPDDHHVLAAAIHSRASIILTFNLKDFPQEDLKRYNIQALSPDEFIFDLLERNFDRVISVIERQASRLRKPPRSLDELLDRLHHLGLVQSVEAIRE